MRDSSPALFLFLLFGYADFGFAANVVVHFTDLNRANSGSNELAAPIFSSHRGGTGVKRGRNRGGWIRRLLVKTGVETGVEKQQKSIVPGVQENTVLVPRPL